MAGVILLLIALTTGLMRTLMSQGFSEEFRLSTSEKMVRGIVAVP